MLLLIVRRVMHVCDHPTARVLGKRNSDKQWLFLVALILTTYETRVRGLLPVMLENCMKHVWIKSPHSHLALSTGG